MNRSLLFKMLIVFSLMTLSSCSQIVVKEVTKEIPVLLPEALLEHPCAIVGAGVSLGSLTKGYLHNTSCVGDYYLLIEKQREWTNEVRKIYGLGN